MFRALMAAAALIACAACETAQEEQDIARLNSEGERLYCKNIRVTGELVPREQCRTKEQIEEANESSAALKGGAIPTGRGALCTGKGVC